LPHLAIPTSSPCPTSASTKVRPTWSPSASKAIPARPNASGALPLRKANEYGEQVARGLAAAHEKGIIHRDLKPEKHLRHRDGPLKILDFGLASLPARRLSPSDAATMASQNRPRRGHGHGRLHVPEQVKGHTADHRSDVFSFGTILYEICFPESALSTAIHPSRP